MTLKIKERTQYTTAIFFLLTGIIMCFLSFFFNDFDIKAGALTYLGEAVAFTSGVFAINIYVRKQVNEAEERINESIDQRMKKVDTLIADE